MQVAEVAVAIVSEQEYVSEPLLVVVRVTVPDGATGLVAELVTVTVQEVVVPATTGAEQEMLVLV